MPGDVIVVLQGRATCDMVLIQGSCLVEESMLSGEVLRSPPPLPPPSSTLLCCLDRGHLMWGFSQLCKAGSLTVSHIRHDQRWPDIKSTGA